MTLNVNDVNRGRYSSNNYKESTLRQWLNSSVSVPPSLKAGLLQKNFLQSQEESLNE